MAVHVTVHSLEYSAMYRLSATDPADCNVLDTLKSGGVKQHHCVHLTLCRAWEEESRMDQNGKEVSLCQSLASVHLQ